MTNRCSELMLASGWARRGRVPFSRCRAADPNLQPPGPMLNLCTNLSERSIVAILSLELNHVEEQILQRLRRGVSRSASSHGLTKFSFSLARCTRVYITLYRYSIVVGIRVWRSERVAEVDETIVMLLDYLTSGDPRTPELYIHKTDRFENLRGVRSSRINLS